MLGQVDARAWIDELGSQLSQRPGYEVEYQADALAVSRSYISDNRLVGSIFLGLFTAGLGLLLLTRRDTESFTVSVVGGSSPDASTARMIGEWSADTQALVAQEARAEATSPSTALDGDVDPQEAGATASAIVLAADSEPVAAQVSATEDDTRGADATRRVAMPREAPPSLVITFDDGQSWTLALVNIVGRSPSASVEEGDQVQLIRIDDPTQSVSKNHARICVEDDGVRVIDQHSTNGTAVVLPDGERVPVDPESGIVVPADSVVEIGELSFTISLSRDGASG